MTTTVFRHLDDALAGVDRVGVVHVGAHRGQEVADYRRVGFDRIVLVEPNPALWPALERLDVAVHRCAAGAAASGAGILNVTAWDERSSLRRPIGARVVRRVPVRVRPLSDLQDGCNVAVLDVQGSELDVLRTGDLGRLDAVVVECCSTRRYHGAAVTADIDLHLYAAGWVRCADYGGHSSPDLVDVVWRSPRCA